MQISRNRTALFTLLLIMGLSQLAVSQGLYWESNEKSGREKKDHVTKSYAMPKMFKVDREGQQSVIVRLDQEKFISIDDKEQTYAEMTFTEMESMMKEAGAAIAGMTDEMKAQLAQLPAEQREMMEKMMKGKMGGGEEEVVYSVQKSGEKKTIAGYAVSKYDVKHDDKTDATIWATTAITGLEGLRNDIKAVQERLSAMMPGKAKAMGKWWSQIEGFPLEVHSDFLDQVVTKVVKQSTPASAFEVPKGYKKTDMMQMHGGGNPPPHGGNH